MKSLQEVQKLLHENKAADMEQLLKERLEDFNAKTNIEEKWRGPYIQNITELYQHIPKYLDIALEVNPIIVKYNDAVKENSLEGAKKYAAEILAIYKKHDFAEYRRVTGILKSRRRWIKKDTDLRKDFFNKLTHASNMVKECRKMIHRKKRLDVKTVYPYWLW